MINQATALEIISNYIKFTSEVISLSQQSGKPIQNWKWICENHIAEVLNSINKSCEYSYDNEKEQESLTLRHRPDNSNDNDASINHTFYSNIDETQFSFWLRWADSKYGIHLTLHIEIDEDGNKAVRLRYHNSENKSNNFSTRSIPVNQ